MVKLLQRMAVILLGSAMLGTILLILAFCLPVERMQQNVAASIDKVLLDAEDVGEDSFSQYVWLKRESYTDAIMVQNAIEKLEDKNVFEHAMWVYHNDLEPEYWAPEESLKAYCAGEDSTFYLHEYSRYWHGYLIYLKPLLCIMTWEHVVWLGIAVQIALMAAVVFLAVRKKQIGVALVAGAGFVFMKPVLVMISLTMSVCWVITLLAILTIQIYHKKLQEKKFYPEFFLIIGILTSYFDFLTYPIVTLGFPMCVYFLVEKGSSVRKILEKVIGYSICWGIGYAGMWAMKWIIADITLRTGTIKDAIWSIIGRTEAIGGRERMNGGGYVIGLNLQEYPEMYWWIAAALAIVSVILAAWAIKKSGIKNLILQMLPFAIIFCMPFAWIVVVQHHSALHARFTFRIISVAVVAICSLAVVAIQAARKNTKNPEIVEKSVN